MMITRQCWKTDQGGHGGAFHEFRVHSHGGDHETTEDPGESLVISR